VAAERVASKGGDPCGTVYFYHLVKWKNARWNIEISVTYSTSSAVPTLGISGGTPTIIHLHCAHTDFAIYATWFVNLTFLNLFSIIKCEGYILQSSSLRNFLILFMTTISSNFTKKKSQINDSSCRLLSLLFQHLCHNTVGYTSEVVVDI